MLRAACDEWLGELQALHVTMCWLMAGNLALPWWTGEDAQASSCLHAQRLLNTTQAAWCSLPPTVGKDCCIVAPEQAIHQGLHTVWVEIGGRVTTPAAIHIIICEPVSPDSNLHRGGTAESWG